MRHRISQYADDGDSAVLLHYGTYDAEDVYDDAVAVYNSGDAYSAFANGSVSLSSTASAESPTLPTGDSVPGSAINIDSLAMWPIGGRDDGKVSFRFVAEQSSQLSGVRWSQAGLGYSLSTAYVAGTGGVVRVSVRGDAAGLPSGTMLAYADHTPSNPSALFPTVTFGSPASILVGQRYHLVFENVATNGSVLYGPYDSEDSYDDTYAVYDYDPPVSASNFVSVRSTYVYGSVLSPRQPSAPDESVDTVLRATSAQGGVYSVEGHSTPIFELTYANSSAQGQGYVGVELTNTPVISGTKNMVRERFTNTGGSRVVTGVAVRLAKTSGVGSLTIRLESSAGLLMDFATVSTASVPVLTRTADASAGVWVTGTFASPQTLANSTEYRIRLSTDDATSLWTRPIRQGDASGFSAATYYSDGLFEFTTNSNLWQQVSGLGSSGDMQFYLIEQE